MMFRVSDEYRAARRLGRNPDEAKPDTASAEPINDYDPAAEDEEERRYYAAKEQEELERMEIEELERSQIGD